MSQQQNGEVALPCSQCAKKQEMIDRYIQLVRLLKKKSQVGQNNKIRDEAVGQMTLEQAVDCLKGETLLHVVGKLGQRRVQGGFNQIRCVAIHSKWPFDPSEDIMDIQVGSKAVPQTEVDFRPSIQGTPSEKSIVRQNASSSMGVESIDVLEGMLKYRSRGNWSMRNIFELKMQKQALTHQVQTLKAEQAETLRRQERQMAKKRQSVLGLVEQLSQKNELIEQLKLMMKSLELRLGCKDNWVLQKLLEEDGESLRKGLIKMQDVNEKLNNDIGKMRQDRSVFEQQNSVLSKQNEMLQIEIKQLKEQLFAYEHEQQQTLLARRELQIVSHRLNLKLDRVKKLQRKLNELSKLRDSLSTTEQAKQDKKIETTMNLQSEEMETQSKLESVFTFLFNISNEGFCLPSTELFDQEERELLLAHKERYMQNAKSAHENLLESIAKRVESQGLVSFGDSILQILQERVVDPSAKSSNMKLIELQIDRSHLVEKISQLKQKQLHIRCVILQLLKSLDLRSVKKETEGILTVLCDFFEYSEEERGAIIQIKAKKFFGFI